MESLLIEMPVFSPVKCSFQKLMRRTDQGGLTGPMSPVLAAKGLAEHLEIHVSNLIRVNFDDELLNQKPDEVISGIQYYTGFDNLIMQSIFTNQTLYTLFVDMGVCICPVILKNSNGENFPLSPVYLGENFSHKLNEAQALQVIDKAIESGAFKIGGRNND